MSEAQIMQQRTRPRGNARGICVHAFLGSSVPHYSIVFSTLPPKSTALLCVSHLEFSILGLQVVVVFLPPIDALLLQPGTQALEEFLGRLVHPFLLATSSEQVSMCIIN